MKRRTFLGASAVTVLAGCLGGSDFDRADHPATQTLTDLPWLGESPTNADGLIVAFEDPSCSTCRRFHETTFLDLRRELLETGDASFVYHPYPIVLAWGEVASRALLATTDRDRAAGWELIDWYYRNQDRLTTENVVASTREFLDDETVVDGGSIVDAVESGGYAAAVDARRAAGDEAGATTTPTFYLFRDDEFVTEFTGVQDVSVFVSSLEG